MDLPFFTLPICRQLLENQGSPSLAQKLYGVDKVWDDTTDVSPADTEGRKCFLGRAKWLDMKTTPKFIQPDSCK